MEEQTNIFDFLSSKKLNLSNKKIHLIELFAGIGAQAKAMETLEKEGYLPNGFRTTICEFDKYAVASYNAVHRTDYKTSDITKIHGNDLDIKEDENTICFYSFCCQDLSNAGKGAGLKKGTRSGLLWEVERLLDEVDHLPEALICENVPTLIGDKFLKDFMVWVRYLEDRGYQSKWEILNAADFGIPQHRERVFMVSWLEKDATYNFPKGKELNYCMGDFLEDVEEVDEKYFLPQEQVDKLIANGNIEIDEGNIPTETEAVEDEEDEILTEEEKEEAEEIEKVMDMMDKLEEVFKAMYKVYENSNYTTDDLIEMFKEYEKSYPKG